LGSTFDATNCKRYEEEVEVNFLVQIGFQFVSARCPICENTSAYLEVFRRDQSREVKGKTEYFSTYSAQVSCSREECWVYENNKCAKSKDTESAVAAAKRALEAYEEWALELDDAVADKDSRCKILQFPGSASEKESAPVKLSYYELE